MKTFSVTLLETYYTNAHLLAQKNAAMPVEKGGLGLHPENTAMDRAKAMGFNTEKTWYHSTLHGDISNFSHAGSFMGHSGMTGIHLTDNPKMASRYLDRYGSYDYMQRPFHKAVVPVLINSGKTKEYDSPVKSGVPLGAPIPKGFVPDYINKGYDSAALKDHISSRGGVRHVDENHKYKISGTEIIMSKPHHIRSIHAAFDPMRKHETDILA